MTLRSEEIALKLTEQWIANKYMIKKNVSVEELCSAFGKFYTCAKNVLGGELEELQSLKEEGFVAISGDQDKKIAKVQQFRRDNPNFGVTLDHLVHNQEECPTAV